MPYVSVRETRSTFENPRRPARGGRLRWTPRSVLQIISAGNAQRAPVDVSATNWSSCPPRLAKTDPLRPARPISWSRGAPGSSIGRTSVNGAGAALPRDQLVIPVEWRPVLDQPVQVERLSGHRGKFRVRSETEQTPALSRPESRSCALKLDLAPEVPVPQAETELTVLLPTAARGRVAGPAAKYGLLPFGSYLTWPSTWHSL
jgi:hypothetical protein